MNPAPEDDQDDLDDMAELANLKEIIEKSQQPTDPSRKREKSLNLENPRYSKDEVLRRKEEGLLKREEERRAEEGRFRDKSAPKMFNKGLSEEMGGVNCSIEEKGRRGTKKIQGSVNASQNQGKGKEGMKENKEVFKVKEVAKFIFI